MCTRTKMWGPSTSGGPCSIQWRPSTAIQKFSAVHPYACCVPPQPPGTNYTSTSSNHEAPCQKVCGCFADGWMAKMTACTGGLGRVSLQVRRHSPCMVCFDPEGRLRNHLPVDDPRHPCPIQAPRDCWAVEPPWLQTHQIRLLLAAALHSRQCQGPSEHASMESSHFGQPMLVSRRSDSIPTTIRCPKGPVVTGRESVPMLS